MTGEKVNIHITGFLFFSFLARWGSATSSQDRFTTGTREGVLAGIHTQGKQHFNPCGVLYLVMLSILVIWSAAFLQLDALEENTTQIGSGTNPFGSHCVLYITCNKKRYMSSCSHRITTNPFFFYGIGMNLKRGPQYCQILFNYLCQEESSNHGEGSTEE